MLSLERLSVGLKRKMIYTYKATVKNPLISLRNNNSSMWLEI